MKPTLQQAKNQVACSYGYQSWFDIDFYAIDAHRQTTKPPYSEESLRDEAAELYAKMMIDYHINLNSRL